MLLSGLSYYRFLSPCHIEYPITVTFYFESYSGIQHAYIKILYKVAPYFQTYNYEHMKPTLGLSTGTIHPFSY